MSIIFLSNDFFFVNFLLYFSSYETFEVFMILQNIISNSITLFGDTLFFVQLLPLIVDK